MKTNDHRRRFRLSALPRLISVVAIVAVTIAPLYWLITLSTLTNAQIVSSPPEFLPSLGRFGPLDEAGGLPLNIWLINSVVVGLGTALLSVAVGLFAAYGLSRFSFRGGGTFGFLVFATQMMPAALLIVPLYNIFAGAHLIDNLASLILADSAFAMPVAIWVIKQAMDGVPRELDESVMIDGGGSLAILRRIVLPLTAPGVAAAGIIAFLSGWNDYLFANTFAVSTNNWTATKGLASFFGQYSTPIDLIMGTSVLFALPPVIFFLLVQRQLVSGLTAGAVKG
ncbi:MAG: carbohydrate ABC transporter permease [Candidatus Limnocylindrales bacterium]|jgi:multiple sugar transport system permease protein